MRNNTSIEVAPFYAATWSLFTLRLTAITVLALLPTFSYADQVCSNAVADAWKMVAEIEEASLIHENIALDHLLDPGGYEAVKVLKDEPWGAWKAYALALTDFCSDK